MRDVLEQMQHPRPEDSLDFLAEEFLNPGFEEEPDPDNPLFVRRKRLPEEEVF